MNEKIATFLTVTGINNEKIAEQFLNLTNDNLDFAVVLFLESINERIEIDDEKKIKEEGVANNEIKIHNKEMKTKNEQFKYDSDGKNHEHRIDRLNINILESKINKSFGQRNDNIFDQRIENCCFDRIDDSEEEDSVSHSENNQNDDNDDVLFIDYEDVLIERKKIKSKYEKTGENKHKQRRLADLYRPSFDIITFLNLDDAKVEGQKKNKWLLINIQKLSIFQSQILNRDLWSNFLVKKIIKNNFLFLQYHFDSSNGITYLNYYNVSDFPHIAILDPITGEKIFQWEDGAVPSVEKWIKDIKIFLTNNSNYFSSDLKGELNPIITESKKVTFANQNEKIQKNNQSDVILQNDSFNFTENNDETNPIDFFSITPKNHLNFDGENSTKIQVKFPNGKRLIHTFKTDDKILSIFEWLKFVLLDKTFYEIPENEGFNLLNISDKSFNFLESLKLTFENANLINVTLYLEKQ